MNVFKKELLALSATLLLGLSAAAQNKRFEHNFYVGLGYATEFANEEAPIAFHVAYGLNCYLSPHWSVMPGVLRLLIHRHPGSHPVSSLQST